MTHKPYLDWMHAALDAGEAQLASDQRLQLDAHLSDCAECRLMWEALTEADRLFASAPMAAPRPGFTGRFKARLAQKRSRPRAVWGALALGLGAVGAAAMVLPVGVGFLFSIVRAAQEPALADALHSSFTASASFAGTVAEALWIAARAVGEWAVGNPLVWAASLAALAVTVMWVYFVRKLAPIHRPVA
jgi:predicted anti-sigma-YlaC factor YlaD